MMKKFGTIRFLMCFFAAAAFSQTPQTPQPTQAAQPNQSAQPAQTIPAPYAVLDVLEKNSFFGDIDYSSQVTLVFTRPSQPQSSMQFQLFQRDKTDQFTIIQLLPEADRGTGYLRQGDNLWIYDPIGRKFTFSSLKESIGGTNAKSADLAHQYRYRTDFTATSIKAGMVGSIPVWIIPLVAKTAKPAYTNMTYYIAKTSGLLLKEEDFSTTGRLMRTVLYPKYTMVNGKAIAIQSLVRNDLVPGEQTQVIIGNISFAPIPDTVFTKAYLEQLN